jgi:hypothetical protein
MHRLAGVAIAALLMTGAALPVLSAETPQAARLGAAVKPVVQGATDGVFAAFREHALVGLSDRHNLAQEGALYVSVIRDPRFAREVGNLVVEFGGASRQGVIDRYVNGESIPYAELRQVWTEVVGWSPGEIGQMYLNLFATVRAVNAELPSRERIRVWLGEPKVDWAQIKTLDDLEPYIWQRDEHAAALIDREILARHKKALIIYGPAHFFSAPPRPASLGYLIKRDHPGSFFLVATYAGYADPSCVARFEAKMKTWTAPVVASPIAGTWLDAALRDCVDRVRFPPPVPGAPALSSEQLARRETVMAKARLEASGALADAFLYLGPSASLTRTPYEQALYLDESYLREATRRRSIVSGSDGAAPVDALRANTASQVPYVPGPARTR